ncbi:hypothetical protein BGX31_008294 [Mortierella sp. GBA43]|nr:hypothetical protein BGX31_008294 [Mortierella sp. GBA43]
MLLTRVWSKLEELRLSNIDLSDSELATVIEGMQKTIGLDILHFKIQMTTNDVFSESDDDADENTTKLHLGLENGLEQLITLQKLDTLALLNMDYNSKQLTEADVKWMASNWKNLKKVYGYLSIDNNKDLSAVLEEAGIGYDSSFWDAPQYRSPNSRHWLAKCDM